MRITALFLLLIFCPLLNAADSKTNQYAEQLPRLKGNETIYILPLNDWGFRELKYSTRKPYNFTADDLRFLFLEISEQLESFGYSVKFIKGPEPLQPSKSIKNVSDLKTAEFEQLQNFVKNLGLDAGIVIEPKLKMRVANLDNKGARWDGVFHTLRQIGGSGFGTWSGQRPVLTLNLKLFDFEGNWLANSYGGVSIPDVAHIPTRELRPKDALFEHRSDQKSARKGIKKSLWPLKKKLKIKR